MNARHALPTAALSILLLASAATAQDAPTAVKHRNVEWYAVSYTQFKPGRVDEARDIVYNHFWTIDQAIGRDVIPFDAETGAWDLIVFFRMEDGPGELAWATSPTDEVWMQAFAEQEGGMEAAEALMERYSELVARNETDVVRRPLPSLGIRLGEAIAVREFGLKDGVDAAAFEQFVVEEHLPAWTHHVPGAAYVIMKGDRGAREGEYVGFFNFDTADRRNYYFPTEDAESYPRLDEAAADILDVRQTYADFATTASAYTDYLLVGADQFHRFPTIQLVGIHDIQVKPRMEETFEQFVAEKLSQVHIDGEYLFVYKGDRGQNEGGYIFVVAFDPAYMRDAYFADPAGTRAYEEAVAPYQEILDEFNSFLRAPPGSAPSTYTDYVIVK